MTQYQVNVIAVEGFSNRTVAMFGVTDEGDAEFNVAPDPMVIALIRAAFDGLEGKAKGVKLRSIGRSERPVTKADRAAREGNGG
jgi:hypothetical protein